MLCNRAGRGVGRDRRPNGRSARLQAVEVERRRRRVRVSAQGRLARDVWQAEQEVGKASADECLSLGWPTLTAAALLHETDEDKREEELVPGDLRRVSTDGVDDLRRPAWLVSPCLEDRLQLMRTHPLDIASRETTRPDDAPERRHANAGLASGDRVGSLEREKVDARQGVLIDEVSRRGCACRVASAVAAEG